MLLLVMYRENDVVQSDTLCEHGAIPGAIHYVEKLYRRKVV